MIAIAKVERITHLNQFHGWQGVIKSAGSGDAYPPVAVVALQRIKHADKVIDSYLAAGDPGQRVR